MILFHEMWPELGGHASAAHVESDDTKDGHNDTAQKPDGDDDAGVS